jgi:hypothetical protein
VNPLSLLLPAIAGIMVVELVVVAFQPAARRRRFLPTMAAGFFIVLAWNASALGWPAWVILAVLACALIAHAADVVSRW